MGAKFVDHYNFLNSLNWNEMIRLISSGDSAACNPVVAHTSRTPTSSAPSMHSRSNASSSSRKLKSDKNNKRKKTKNRSSEDGYKSKIQRFLNPCMSNSSNKQIRRRLADLERKVNDFEKLYWSALVNWLKETKEKLKPKNSISDDEVTEVFVSRHEKKKLKKNHKSDEGNIIEMEETKQHGTRQKPPKQLPSEAKSGSAKNTYTVRQIRKLSPHEIGEEVSIDSNIDIISENGKYYFMTSTAGYITQIDEDETNSSSSAPYEAAASIAKFNKKNLVYLFSQEILPRCYGSSHKNYNGCKSNKTNKIKFMKKYVSDKSTSTDKIYTDKSVNTKERYYQFKEEISPSSKPVNIIIHTKKADTFESNSPENDLKIIYDDLAKSEVESVKVESKDICFSAYPSSSSTSFSETSDNYIKLSKELKNLKN
ncbi:micronuclear linker histone polyprotein isoform X2 [Halyomorpha halys]|uniref:micronuclear linker histone polyprotein isoform X2 n=1 Tax=Halyomorpha halys TaxID=286706 RepID=UPI0034D2647D